MSELGTAFFQFALAQITVQASMPAGAESYGHALTNLEYCSEQLAEAFYNAEIVDPFGEEAKESE